MAKFKMFKISIPQFAILSENCENSYNIEARAEYKYSIERRAIAVEINFSFMGNKEKAMILYVICEFEIYPDDWNSMIADNKITIPKGLLEHFLVHTVGTARGILHCKTEGTPFNSIVLPPMDVTRMITSDLIILIDK